MYKGVEVKLDTFSAIDCTVHVKSLQPFLT